tara:strand:+ start:843 stop:968 length:126 start_codon:yes stop_codon:yes gene_type:complete
MQRKMASPGESGAQRKSLAAPVQNAPELDQGSAFSQVGDEI